MAKHRFWAGQSPDAGILQCFAKTENPSTAISCGLFRADYVAEQLGIDPSVFALYGHPIWTRFAHSRHLAQYLGVRPATREDRRTGLLAAVEAASTTDLGLPIMTAVVGEFRRRGVLLLSDAALEKIGLAGRAIARQRAEAALLDGLSADQMEQLHPDHPQRTG